jgi:hypothetical protein
MACSHRKAKPSLTPCLALTRLHVIAFRALEIISFETRVLQVSLEFGLGPGRIRLQVMLVISMRAQLLNWNGHSRR